MCKPRVFDAHIVKALGRILVNHARGPALFSIPVMPHKLQVLLGQLVRCSPLRPRRCIATSLRHSAQNRAHSTPSPTTTNKRRPNPLTTPLHTPSPPPPRTRAAAAAAATAGHDGARLQGKSASCSRRHTAWALGVAQPLLQCSSLHFLGYKLNRPKSVSTMIQKRFCINKDTQ